MGKIVTLGDNKQDITPSGSYVNADSTSYISEAKASLKKLEEFYKLCIKDKLKGRSSYEIEGFKCAKKKDSVSFKFSKQPRVDTPPVGVDEQFVKTVYKIDIPSVREYYDNTGELPDGIEQYISAIGGYNSKVVKSKEKEVESDYDAKSFLSNFKK